MRHDPSLARTALARQRCEVLTVLPTHAFLPSPASPRHRSWLEAAIVASSLAWGMGCPPAPGADAGDGTAQVDGAVVQAGDAGVPRAEGSACDPTVPRCRLGLICVVDIQHPRDGGAGTCRPACTPAAPDCEPDRACVPLAGWDAGACLPGDGGA